MKSEVQKQKERFEARVKAREEEQAKKKEEMVKAGDDPCQTKLK